MDVRFFNFLARQPSATLIERPSFCGLPKRGIALILVQAMFWQPLLAQADGIAVSGTTNTTVGKAGNGVPIVNIAAPNASGLSHNQYQQYNVGTQGVILNNATDRTQSTQLGGIILGNQNLNGRAASTILNEVIGANATQLKGYTEVAGQTARVIVANPYGISCNGCGFINTPQVTLTTGKPVLDNGRLDHFRVDSGSVSIDGGGLNADNVDQFDIITRSAKINAELHAKKLNVVTGRNDVDAQTLNATALADDGSAKPQLAIDSSALGGMYAGAIRLVGTEAGVGVKLAGNLAASAGDIQIDTNGQLIMAQVAANGAVNVKAATADVQGAMYGNSVDLQTRDALNIQQNIAARDRINLSSNGQLTNNAIVEAGVNADDSRNARGDVALSAQNLRNNGTVIASRDLSAKTSQSLDNSGRQITAGGNLALNVQGTLNNQSGLISAGGAGLVNAEVALNSKGRISSKRDLNAIINTLNNQKGEVVAQGNLTLKGSQLDNRTGGLVGSTKALSLDVSDIDNRSGELSSSADVRITASQLNNSRVGKVLAGGTMGLNIANVFNQDNGLIYAGSALRLDGGLLNNSSGTLSGQTDLTVNLSVDLDNGSGLLSSEGTLDVTARTLTNTAGKVSSAGALSVVTQGAVSNQQGSISTDGTLALTSASLDNRNQGAMSGKGATVVSTGAFDNSHNGQLTSADSLILNAAQVTNQDGGRIAAAKAVTASVTGLDQQAGELFSNGTLTLDLTHGQLNNQNGLINAPDALLLKNLAGVNNQNGEISSALGFEFNADSLDNSNGKLLSDQSLMVRVAHALANVNGAISAAAIDARVGSLDNTDGLLSSRGEMTLSVDDTLINHNATLIADGKLMLNAANVDNSLGQIASKQDLVANIGGLQQQGGQFIALGSLSLTGTQLDNSHNGLLSADGLLTLNVANIDNRGGEVSSHNTISVTAQQLDNSDAGRVDSQKNLTLAVDRLANRNNGVLTGKTGLSLTGARLDNSGGSLFSLQNVDLGLSGDVLNNLGLLSSEGRLSVRSGSLTNDGGSLSSAGALSIDSSGAVSSRGGKLITDGSLTLNSASLDNSQNGSISGKGAVAIHTGDFDNSHDGRVTSADSLELSAAHLSNHTGGSIGSNKVLTASVSGLDQQGGTLFSNASLTLDMNRGQLNNQNGLINAPGALLLKNLAGVNNQNGEISSTLGFEFNADSLDNSDGKLLSNQALVVRVAQALTNVKGMIAAASLNARSGTLDNSAGTLTSRGDLTLDVDGLLNNGNDGLINAAQTLNLQATGINNVGGTLLGATALNLDLNGADLDNSNGLITTQNPLVISHLRDLKNAGGEISSSQRFSVTGRTLDNSSGKLISNQQLTLNAESLLNQLGLISGWEGLSVSGGSLDNRNGGTLSSRNGSVGIDLTGALLNAGNGALVSQKTLDISAASVDNRGGILSSGAGQTYTVSGLLDNGQDGLIDSGAALSVNAAQLGNAAGAINAQQALSFTGTDLDNSAGSIASNAGITLDLLGSLTNSSGKLASAGDLLISRAAQINNQGGQLASQRATTLFTDGLDNSNRGTVAANDALLLTASGAIQNANDGLIYSKNAGLTVQAASLANSQGTLQSQGALNLTVSGDIDSQAGKIIAQGGDLNLTANNVDNRGGVLSSLQNAFTARISGVLKNGYDLDRQGGITQAQRLDIRALAGIDNYGGRISAQSGDALIDTGSGNFDNRNGGLYARQKINVTGNNFDNSGDNDGQIAGQQIDLNLSGALNNRLGIIESDSTLNITAASLDNQSGKLRALGSSGTTNFQIGGLLDNRNGALETANTDLNFGVGSLLNSGGTVLHVGNGNFGVSTANIMSAGGSFISRGALTLNADSWTNNGVIQASTLNVNVNHFTQTATGQLLASGGFVGTGGNWINEGVIASDGALNLTLGGGYSGNGRASSLGTLALTASQLTMGSAASIAGGARTDLNISGSATGYGRITSGANLIVNAGSLANYGTLGAAQALTVTTPALSNQGLIFSGADMQLNTATLTNLKGDFYSLRNLTVGGYGTARANQVSNISGSMESGGAFSINATAFENRTEGSDGTQNFSVGRTLVKGFIAVQCIDCSGDHYEVNYIARETFDAGEDSDTTASSLLTAGGDFTFTGSTFLNSKSTVSAGGNISIQADNVKNLGAVSGTVERTRTYYQGRVTDGTVNRFMPEVVAYNQRDNPDFPKVYYVAASGEIRLAVVTFATGREPGHDGGLIKVTTVKDAVTGENVSNRTLSGYSWGNTPSSHYDPANLLQLPTALSSLALVSDVEVAKNGTGSAGRSAVIQAAGNVSITATKDLQNSVIHQDYASAAGTNKVADTRASGTGTTLVVQLNAQLPPDLAQQQVDPTSLPGFSLPAGQNGLFRLSAEGGTQAGVSTQNWSLGTATVTATQRDQALPGISSRDVLVADASAPITSGQLLTVADRQNADVSASVSTVNVDNSPPGLTRVQGLPSYAAKPSTGKYLIETNPVLTDLKQFMSSDYMLSALGYDPDLAQKRLGDGLYEQRLVQQAITARTGQAFIDGQTSNEDQFKYLMNNAIASKDALNLSVGVSLTSQQVAALTHDIVWLEEHEVNGEKVLVPVLYLAQADGRLAPNGALIAGKDVTLIAGENLDNVGTLKATNNLSATAGQDLVNSGLISAGNRLDALAGNDITNKAGGIIAGRDVTVTAIGGDVTNERTITSLDSSTRGRLHKDYADSAARIEAANDLSVSAGRDINNIGSALQSGRDLTLSAGRDVNTVSSQMVNSLVLNRKHTSSDVTQTTSTISAGRDLSVQAGRDVNAIATQIDAKRDIAIAATENVTIASAADENHFLSKSKKLTVQEDHVHQVSTEINAGGSVAVSAGQNLAVISSRITAGDEAYLVAGDKLDILAAQESDYSLYNKKSKGSFGRKKTKRDEVTQVTNIGSEITSGGNMMLVSGGDQHYQVAKLDSGKDLTLDSGGAITFEGVKDLHQESHEKSNSSLAWTSMSGKGRTDETLRQSELIAKGNLAIKAVDGLHIDVKRVNQQTVSEAIDAMVTASPDLAWLKDAEKRGDVDWRMVKEIHQSFKYSHSGLGAGAQLALAILLAAFTGGAGAGLIGATAGTFSAGLANAVVVSLEVSTANSAISNKGNLGAVVKDTFSKGSLQSAAVSGLTAGFINYASSNWFGASMDSATGKITGPSVVPSLMDPAALARFSAIQLAGGAVNGALNEALGTGTFKDSMMGSVFTVLQATAFNGVGDIGKKFDLPESGAYKIALHAVVGGLLSEVMGGDFKTGAAAAGANEALIEYLDKSEFLKGADATDHDRMVNAASKLVGLFAAAAVGGDISKGSEIAGNAQSYNRQLHTFEKKMLAAEAAKLDEQGKSNSGISWEALLNLEAGADIDATAAAQLKAILDTGADVNPEKQHLLDDMAVAEGVVTQLKNQKIQLTWSDGTPIVAKGDAVYAFSATAAQYKDSTLFNSKLGNATSGDDVGAIPVEWANQFGPAAALQHQNEIGSIGTSNWQNQNVYQQMTTILGGGIVPLLSEKDILLMAATSLGGSAAKGIMAYMAERRAAGLVGEGADDILTAGSKGLEKDYVDILSPEAKQHILYGEKPGSGGHMWPGQEGKTVFPESWSGDKIVDAIGDITTSPSTKWYAQTGTGGIYTAKGDAAKWVAYESRDGVRMRVIYQPATGKVVTAFPDDAPIPPYKPIR
ncbi:filamentous hemagglutinin N-terminal domain-containing protein [Pseudomonas sp. F3-2]|uniref:two-partner secretion domain-containing protein n=1 Tax=Pseudomonas sp. F3-2 TaxID=3141539 RepID=UPI00315D6BC1